MENYKEARKIARKNETEARKVKLKEQLKVGAFVKNVWGATMRRVSYYEIVAIEGKRVALRPALISGDPSPNCASSVVTLLGSSAYGGDVNYRYATVRMGYLLKEGKSLTSSWSTYEFVNIGDTTDTWSD